MVSKQVLVVANVSLVLVAIVLTLTLFNVTLPTVGRTLDALNKEPLSCAVQWGNEITALDDLGQCCLEARSQLGCHQEQGNWVCQTGSGKTLRYILNTKAYHYCQEQVIWD